MFSVWAGSGELFGLCFRSGDRVCGAKYWKLWYRIPWCMLTLAAAKGFWGCFYCTSVSTTHHLLRLRRRKHREDIVMHLRVKRISSVPKVFRENTPLWEPFLFAEACLLLVNSASCSQRCLLSCRGLIHLHSQSPSPSMLSTCTSDPASSNRRWVNVRTTVRKRGELKLLWRLSGQRRTSRRGTWAEGRTGGKAESANMLQNK